MNSFVPIISILAKRKKIDFDIQLYELGNDEIYTDEFRLAQVLLNLLTNAVKFTRTGYVCLAVHPSEDGCLHFSVIDTGIGINDSK